MISIPEGFVGTMPWHPRPFGAQPTRMKDGSQGYRVKRGGMGCSASSTPRVKDGGLSKHNCPLSYRLQPKKAREA